jgi:hypothetical protein
LLHFGMSTSVKLQENCSRHPITLNARFTSNLDKSSAQLPRIAPMFKT